MESVIDYLTIAPAGRNGHRLDRDCVWSKSSNEMKCSDKLLGGIKKFEDLKLA